MKYALLFLIVLLQISCTSVSVNYADTDYLAELEKAKQIAKAPGLIYREIIGGEVVFVLR